MLMRTIYVVLVKQTTAKMNIAALILLILVNCGLRCICSTTDGRLLVKMTLVKNASALGAFCLDGSLPAYHFHPGFGDGARNWILAFEGGGWCNDLPSCLERAKTRRGSTRYMNKLQTFSGILSNNASLNPDFYNWNRVKLRYCDGGSFSGDAEFKNGTSTLYFRGKRIWEAIIQDLLPKGLGQAHKALLSGCSAGGLSAFHQCDNFAKILPSNSTVKCLSDAGFFLDEQDISMNRTMRSFYAKLVTLQGSVKNLNNNCTRTLSDPKLCFFPQYALKFIKTPLFILNTAYDVFQLNHILVPPSADRGGQWKSCKLNTADCNANQIDILQGFRSDMLAALRSFFRYSSSGGMFINSCFAHCQSESQDTWLAADSPTVHYKTIARTVGDWYFGRGISKEIDCPYPCDRTCHNLIQTAPDDRRFLSYQSHSDLDGCEDCPKHHEDKNAAIVLKPMLGIGICLIYMVAFFF